MSGSAARYSNAIVSPRKGRSSWRWAARNASAGVPAPSATACSSARSLRFNPSPVQGNCCRWRRAAAPKTVRLRERVQRVRLRRAERVPERPRRADLVLPHGVVAVHQALELAVRQLGDAGELLDPDEHEARTTGLDAIEDLGQLEHVVEVGLEPQDDLLAGGQRARRAARRAGSSLRARSRDPPIRATAMKPARSAHSRAASRPAGTGPSCSASRHGSTSPEAPAARSRRAAPSPFVTCSTRGVSRTIGCSGGGRPAPGRHCRGNASPAVPAVAR